MLTTKNASDTGCDNLIRLIIFFLVSTVCVAECTWTAQQSKINALCKRLNNQITGYSQEITKIDSQLLLRVEHNLVSVIT